jgi:hypothetical protein
MPEMEWVRRQDLPERYPIAIGTWNRWAHRGGGPPYVRVGKHALYRIDDVERWLNEHRVEVGQ